MTLYKQALFGAIATMTALSAHATGGNGSGNEWWRGLRRTYELLNERTFTDSVTERELGLKLSIETLTVIGPGFHFSLAGVDESGTLIAQKNPGFSGCSVANPVKFKIDPDHKISDRAEVLRAVAIIDEKLIKPCETQWKAPGSFFISLTGSLALKDASGRVVRSNPALLAGVLPARMAEENLAALENEILIPTKLVLKDELRSYKVTSWLESDPQRRWTRLECVGSKFDFDEVNQEKLDKDSLPELLKPTLIPSAVFGKRVSGSLADQECERI